MGTDTDARVRELAYAIWEREGRPDGDAGRHWGLAEEELRAEATGSGAEQPDEERPDRPQDDAQVDEAVDETFPASDPPAYMGGTRPGAPSTPT